MKKALAALFCAAAAALSATGAWAQMTPVGTWRSVDDKTGEAKSEIRIADNGGVLSGQITRLLRKGADPQALCTECRDGLKDKPMVGLQIISGARKAEGKEVWEDGKILDPESGKSYTLRLTPVGGGDKLEVRGSIGPFGRTQTWVRVQ